MAFNILMHFLDFLYFAENSAYNFSELSLMVFRNAPITLYWLHFVAAVAQQCIEEGVNLKV
jgi:hypothetical protein